MNPDARAYRPPGGSEARSLPIDVEPWQCLRIPVTVATVWLFPWGERKGTTYALVDRPDALEAAHLAPGTVDALTELASIVERASLLSSPAWPAIDGPTPTSRRADT